MPDNFDSTGLTIASLSEVVSTLATDMQGIYGSDINVDSNSPDGQMINIFSQVSIDQRELLLGVYNMFSVENSYGINLSNLVSLNGIARQAATYTTTPVAVTTTTSLTLVGQDTTSTTATIFTVEDTSGYLWELQTTTTVSAGTTTLTFVCTTPGAISPSANSINIIYTAIAGITSVNNPTISGTAIGVNEESDVALKIRRGKMFSLASTGPSAALRAALLAQSYISDAYVFENNTGSTVGVIPAHSIHAVINYPSGYELAVGNVIFVEKLPGTGMVGSKSYTIYGVAGLASSTMYWDIAVAQPLYIKFTGTPKNSSDTYDDSAIKAALASALVYTLNASPNIGDVVIAMNNYDDSIILSNVYVSTDGSTWATVVNPTAQVNYFTVSASNITISGI
jgi:hypothetical protein